MAQITLKGNPIHTIGDLPAIGEIAQNVELTRNDLSKVDLNSFSGSRIILNIFPAINTGICAASVRAFNKSAAGLENTKVLCISMDTPEVQKTFCGAEGIDNVETLSDNPEGNFGKAFNLQIVDSALKGLLSRSVIVLDTDLSVLYTEQVPEIVQEPNYEAALASLA